MARAVAMVVMVARAVVMVLMVVVAGVLVGHSWEQKPYCGSRTESKELDSSCNAGQIHMKHTMLTQHFGCRIMHTSNSLQCSHDIHTAI